jgi:hypothetical protein
MKFQLVMEMNNFWITDFQSVGKLILSKWAISAMLKKHMHLSNEIM